MTNSLNVAVFKAYNNYVIIIQLPINYLSEVGCLILKIVPNLLFERRQINDIMCYNFLF